MGIILTGPQCPECNCTKYKFFPSSNWDGVESCECTECEHELYKSNYDRLAQLEAENKALREAMRWFPSACNALDEWEINYTACEGYEDHRKTIEGVLKDG